MNYAFSKIWIIVIVVVLIAGGFFAWQYFGAPEKEVSAPGKEVVEDKTANWKTFTNTFTNYQIKYPNNWQAVDKTAKTQPVGYLIELSDPLGKDKNNLRIFSGPTTAGGTECWRRDTEEILQVADIKAVKFLYLPSGDEVVRCDLPETARMIIVDFEKDNVQYSLEFHIFDGNLELVNTILSTFRFIEVDETADWKIYQDEEYGFEMKYPEDFFPTQSLQPKTKVIQCDYANFTNKCPFVLIEGFTGTEESAFRQGFAAKPTPERIIINGVPFCQQENREGAMGTSYITYNYTTAIEKECFVVSFAVGYPNCSNYLPIENQKMQEAYDKCRLDNEVTKPETINKILSTFKFLK